MGYGIKIFVPRPLYYVTRSPGEAALFLDSIKRPLVKSNTGIPRLMDFSSPCASSESSLNWLRIQNIYFAHSQKNWTFTEVAILGADQKERGLRGRQCPASLTRNSSQTYDTLVLFYVGINLHRCFSLQNDAWKGEGGWRLKLVLILTTQMVAMA